MRQALALDYNSMLHVLHHACAALRACAACTSCCGAAPHRKLLSRMHEGMSEGLHVLSSSQCSCGPTGAPYILQPSRVPPSLPLASLSSKQNKEFVRVGYYVNNDYTDADLIEAPPEKPVVEKLQRNVMSDHPRYACAPPAHPHTS